MKTSMSGYPSHYMQAVTKFGDRLKVLKSETKDVPDVYYEKYIIKEYKNEEDFGRAVALFVKGFWCDILEEGLRRFGGISDTQI
jgi:hypothetical protein